MEIVLIGSGNAGSVLGSKFRLAGHKIQQVISQNPGHASILASKLGAHHASSWRDIYRLADIYILAISDQALMSLDDQFSLDRKLVVHTAGSVPMNVLENLSKNYGVLYPLQSLRKENPEVAEIPFLIEANTPENLTVIQDLARSISPKVFKADGDARIKYHLAAVVVNNFSNHLFTMAEGFCRDEHLKFDLLLPLMKETVERLEKFDPGNMQTGPAMRNDDVTIKNHLKILEKYPSLQALYQFFSKSIEDRPARDIHPFPNSGN